MSLSIAQLEHLADKLEQLTEQLHSDSTPGQTLLAPDDPLVGLAKDCEFMLPSPLTRATLLETAERKINNVQVLLERARQNQDIPPDAQLAADNEDTLIRGSSRL